MRVVAQDELWLGIGVVGCGAARSAGCVRFEDVCARCHYLVVVMPYGRHMSPAPDGDGERDPAEPRVPGRSESSGGLSRRSGIWLTTLSTVVAVATGMFTLR